MGKLLDITRKLYPTKSELQDLADRLTKAPKDRINSNRANGVKLKNSTIASKRRRGSSTPDTKLRDTGELVRDIRNKVKKDMISVGNTSKKHSLAKRTSKRRWKKGRSGKKLTMAQIGKIHNEGNGVPRRSYLFPKRGKIFKEESQIILDWHNERSKKIFGS